MPSLQELDLETDGGFYGEDYWFEHARRHGRPDLAERSRSDLVDRVPRWLRSVLRYRSPPGRTLEIGCAHGALTHLLSEAGFDAQGLELSPVAAAFARDCFGIDVLEGTLERQTLVAASFDVVLAFDVLEHALDPQALLARTAELIADDGILVLQTPCRPGDPRAEAGALLSYEVLREARDPFLTMLIAEHLFLFPRSALAELLGRLGFVEIAWQEAPFPYDMLLVASRRPLRQRPDGEIAADLLATPRGRRLLALLDADAALEGRTEVMRAAERARSESTERLQQVRLLARQLARKEQRQRERAAVAEHDLEKARKQADALVEAFDGLRHSGFYRSLVRSGRWRSYDERVQQILSPNAEDPPPGVELAVDVEAALPESSSGVVAVDLTSILPGALNGGAKLTSLRLIRDLVRLDRDSELVLLTSQRSHEELAPLEGPRVRRHLLELEPTSLMRLHDEKPLSLLICPMGPPHWIDPRVPTLTIIHDLQHTAYPEFFDSEERETRRLALERATRWSDRIVTVSEYVRSTVLDHTALSPERVVSIPHGVRDRLPPLSDAEIDRVCAEAGLDRERYLLYPANCWPHKNHSMLLTAFARLYGRRPQERLRLVLTGADGEDAAGVRDQAIDMGLEEVVLWLGYLPEATFSGILRGCRALIFPSLYEGFGMPIVEAMAAGRPILCARTTALPEVAGEAAIFFDPRRPHDICAAIERLLDDPALEQRLISAGQRRLDSLAIAEECSRRYFDLTREIRSRNFTVRSGVAGLWGDQWTQGRLLVGVAEEDDRVVRLTFANSRDDSVEIRVEHHRLTVPPSHLANLTCRVPAGSRLLELEIDPTFSPKERGESDDDRRLGLELVEIRLAPEDAQGD